jgi:hypothetical protein
MKNIITDESLHMKSLTGCSCVIFYFDNYSMPQYKKKELLKQNWGVVPLAPLSLKSLNLLKSANITISTNYHNFISVRATDTQQELREQW